MTKEENKQLANKIRDEIHFLRKQGYMMRIFYEAINYSPSRFYNFMSKGYSMSDEDLLYLKE